MKLEGVKKTEVDWKKGEVIVEYDPSKVNTSQMVKAVNDSRVFKVKAAEDLSGRLGGQGQGGKR